MKHLASGLSRAAEGIAAALLAAMFLTFLLQILGRYVMLQPFGWTLELCLILWVWIVFFGCAFVVRDGDHVRFDILVLAVPPGPRRVMAILAALAVAGGMAWSFLPTWDYIDWIGRRRTATVENPLTGEKIRLKWIFVIYAVFLVALTLRSLWTAAALVRRGLPPDGAPGDGRADGGAIDRGDEVA